MDHRVLNQTNMRCLLETCGGSPNQDYSKRPRKENVAHGHGSTIDIYIYIVIYIYNIIYIYIHMNNNGYNRVDKRDSPSHQAFIHGGIQRWLDTGDCVLHTRGFLTKAGISNTIRRHGLMKHHCFLTTSATNHSKLSKSGMGVSENGVCLQNGSLFMGKIMINQRILWGTQTFPTNPALCRGLFTYGKHFVSGHPSVGIIIFGIQIHIIWAMVNTLNRG